MMTLWDSREWTTIASSKTRAGSATSMRACCPRQEWPHSSLIIKHYRVQVRIHHQGFRSLYACYTSFPWTSQSVAWGAREHMEWRLQVSKPQDTSHICMNDLGWFRGSKNNLSRTHGGILHQMHMNSRKSPLPSKHKLHERNTKALLTKFSTLGWCSTWIMGETKCCWWVQQQLIGISISLDFHHHVNTVIALVRPKM